MTDLYQAVANGAALPEKACLITFDDGLLCQYEEALQVLDEIKVPAAFFVLGGPYSKQSAATVHKLHYVRAHCGDDAVYSVINALVDSGVIPCGPKDMDAGIAKQHYRYDAVENAKLKYFLNYKAPAEFTQQVTNQLLTDLGLSEVDFISTFYMTPDMIRDLGARGFLGSHAESHRPLANMSDEAIKGELVRSCRTLEEISGTDILAISYPLGNADAVNRHVADISRDVGYRLAWTMERAINRSFEDPLMLGRLDAADIGNIGEFGPRQRYLDET